MISVMNDLGIDLGTANLLIYQSGKGIVIREPSVAAFDKNSGNLLQVGTEAELMLGRTPINTAAIRPMKSGVVADYDLTVRMLSAFFRKIARFSAVKPRAVIAVPCSISEMEERAVVQAVLEAGARRAYLIEEPLAAALGAGIDLSGADGYMVVDIGGGTTDIAVLSVNAVVSSESITAAGDYFDEEIIKFVRKNYNVSIGLQAAENIKRTIGSVSEEEMELKINVSGLELKSRLPRNVELSSADLREVLLPGIDAILNSIRNVLENTPPDLIQDIAKHGILLTGGGALLRGIDEAIENGIGISCYVADDCASCVALGLGKSLGWISNMQEGTQNFNRKKMFGQ